MKRRIADPGEKRARLSRWPPDLLSEQGAPEQYAEIKRAGELLANDLISKSPGLFYEVI